MRDPGSVRQLARRLGLRRKVAAGRMAAERNVLARLPSRDGEAESRILCYHSVGTPAWGVNDVPPALFRRHIELALEAGYTFAPARSIANGTAPSRSLAITFDDGLTTVATQAAPILRDYAIPWSLYVVSDWASGQHRFESGAILGWHELEAVAAAGASIGSHSVTHPNFGRLDSQRLPHELSESREEIRRALGITVDEFAIPFGQSGNWSEEAMATARDAGYTVVYAQSEGRRPLGTVARTFITRFDTPIIFKAALRGRFDEWEEWA